METALLIGVGLLIAHKAGALDSLRNSFGGAGQGSGANVNNQPIQNQAPQGYQYPVIQATGGAPPQGPTTSQEILGGIKDGVSILKDVWSMFGGYAGGSDKDARAQKSANGGGAAETWDDPWGSSTNQDTGNGWDSSSEDYLPDGWSDPWA